MLLYFSAVGNSLLIDSMLHMVNDIALLILFHFGTELLTLEMSELCD